MVHSTVSTAALSDLSIVLKDKTIERANQIAERTGSLEIGLAKALLIEKLEAKLADNQLCRILFVKRDGSLRDMLCVSNPILNSKLVKGVGHEHFGTKVVYDVEKAAYRSFRYESLVKVF